MQHTLLVDTIGKLTRKTVSLKRISSFTGWEVSTGLFRCTTDNQKNGLETPAKASMLLTRHPRYGLICHTLEPCNFTLNILQDFLLVTYFKHERQCLRNYRLSKFLMDITKLKPNAECLRSF